MGALVLMQIPNVGMRCDDFMKYKSNEFFMKKLSSQDAIMENSFQELVFRPHKNAQQIAL